MALPTDCNASYRAVMQIECNALAHVCIREDMHQGGPTLTGMRAGACKNGQERVRKDCYVA